MRGLRSQRPHCDRNSPGPGWPCVSYTAEGGRGEKTAKETDTSPAAAQCPRRQQHCRAGELVLRGDYKLVSVHTKYIVRFFFLFLQNKIDICHHKTFSVKRKEFRSRSQGFYEVISTLRKPKRGRELITSLHMSEDDNSDYSVN